MQITPNNVLPQVGQVAFQPNVGVPEGGVYQSLALGMQMMDQPVRQRIALEQLEQVKANTELDKQRLDMQIQEFDFRKEQIERANLKELEEYRNGAYTKANALFGLQTLTDEEDAILSSALERNGVNQTAVDMLLTGSEAQARDVNANIQKAMGDRDVMKIFQKNAATKALMDEYSKCPTCFDGAAVTAKIREAHVNPNLTAKDFHPSKFVNQIDPEDQLKSQFDKIYLGASPAGRVHVERRLVDRLKAENPKAVMTNEQGALLPEWQEKVDYILGKNDMNVEEIAQSLTYLADLQGIEDPKQREAFIKSSAHQIELAQQLDPKIGGRTALMAIINKSYVAANSRGTQEAAYNREQLKSDTKLTLQANEPVKAPKGPTNPTNTSGGPKMSAKTYMETRGSLYGGSMVGEAKQAANLLYQNYGLDLSTQTEATKLQQWVKKAAGDPTLGANMYLAEKNLPSMMKNQKGAIEQAVKEAYTNPVEIRIEGDKITFATKKGGPRSTVTTAELIAGSPTLQRVASTLQASGGAKAPAAAAPTKAVSTQGKSGVNW